MGARTWVLDFIESCRYVKKDTCNIDTYVTTRQLVEVMDNTQQLGYT